MENLQNFYYHHICHTCKMKTPDIKVCSGCRLVSYCSGLHQKMDWEYHRPICKSVQLVLKERNADSIFPRNITRSADEWRRNIPKIVLSLELRLQRPLELYEKQMFFFPSMCPVCFAVESGRTYACENCNYICYCSPEHKNQDFINHAQECSQFQLCYEIDKIFYDSKFNPMDYELPYPNGKPFPENIYSFLNIHANNYSSCYQIMLTDHLGGSLSLLYAINSSFYLHEKNNLTIHIIGASDYEQTVLMSVELLFHWLPQLEKLCLVLVGPHVCSNYLEPIFCKYCSENKQFSVSYENKLYHHYVISNAFVVPDMVVSFNCGFSEFLNTAKDTWSKSIKCIWKFDDTLLVFTSFTRSEAIADFSAVKQMKPIKKPLVTPIKFLHKNPFRSLRPHRNWDYTDGPFFYNNNYILAIHIKD